MADPLIAERRSATRRQRIEMLEAEVLVPIEEAVLQGERRAELQALTEGTNGGGGWVQFGTALT